MHVGLQQCLLFWYGVLEYLLPPVAAPAMLPFCSYSRFVMATQDALKVGLVAGATMGVVLMVLGATSGPTSLVATHATGTQTAQRAPVALPFASARGPVAYSQVPRAAARPATVSNVYSEQTTTYVTVPSSFSKVSLCLSSFLVAGAVYPIDPIGGRSKITTAPFGFTERRMRWMFEAGFFFSRGLRCIS